jgi:hypothetical protein
MVPAIGEPLGLPAPPRLIDQGTARSGSFVERSQTRQHRIDEALA